MLASCTPAQKAIAPVVVGEACSLLARSLEPEAETLCVTAEEVLKAYFELPDDPPKPGQRTEPLRAQLFDQIKKDRGQ